MTQITIKQIVDMCRVYTNDAKIAKLLNCSKRLVEACRPMVYSRTHPKPGLEIDPETQKYSQFMQRSRNEQERIRVATQQLLIKQLETGHHWLSNDRFFDVVSNLKPEFGLHQKCIL